MAGNGGANQFVVIEGDDAFRSDILGFNFAEVVNEGGEAGNWIC